MKGPEKVADFLEGEQICQCLVTFLGVVEPHLASWQQQYLCQGKSEPGMGLVHNNGLASHPSDAFRQYG